MNEETELQKQRERKRQNRKTKIKSGREVERRGAQESCVR